MTIIVRENAIISFRTKIFSRPFLLRRLLVHQTRCEGAANGEEKKFPLHIRWKGSAP